MHVDPVEYKWLILNVLGRKKVAKSNTSKGTSTIMNTGRYTGNNNKYSTDTFNVNKTEGEACFLSHRHFVTGEGHGTHFHFPTWTRFNATVVRGTLAVTWHCTLLTINPLKDTVSFLFLPHFRDTSQELVDWAALGYQLIAGGGGCVLASVAGGDWLCLLAGTAVTGGLLSIYREAPIPRQRGEPITTRPGQPESAPTE